MSNRPTDCYRSLVTFREVFFVNKVHKNLHSNATFVCHNATKSILAFVLMHLVTDFSNGRLPPFSRMNLLAILYQSTPIAFLIHIICGNLHKTSPYTERPGKPSPAINVRTGYPDFISVLSNAPLPHSYSLKKPSASI